MDWKTEAVYKLKQYKAKRQSLEVIPIEVAQVESALDSIRSARTDCARVKGSTNYEDRSLNCIAKKSELLRSLEYVKIWVDAVDKALAVLDSEERRLLDCFYMSNEKGAAQRLAAELFVDAKTVYARKDKALRKFTIALYGSIET